MTQIVKIHGTSGAGKSTIAFNLLDASVEEPVKLGPNPKRPEAYRIRLPNSACYTYILGPYENQCGGMDGIVSTQEQIQLVHKYAELGNVVYEGLLISTYYGGFGKEMEVYGDKHIWAFLDTPIDVCIDRVKARRLAAGNEKPLNERNTRERVKPIISLQNKLILGGANVKTLNWDKDPTGQVMEWLS